jgi:general nucleoside transport system permease protein
VTIRLEQRATVPRWLSPALTVLAVAVALVISGAVIAGVGGNPVASYLHILNASFGSIGVFSDTLVKATPLILTGLACALAFRMRLWNIGAEGQFLLGAWGASAVVLIPLAPAGTPAIILIPLMALAGMLAGGVWGLIPGVLRARLGVNEIIATLMLNYVALFWIQFWVFGPWSESGFQQTKAFPQQAWLPRLADFASSVPAFAGLTVHLGLIFGIVAAGLLWVFLERSRWGYEIRLIGDSPRAARYAGIDIAKRLIIVFAISGALAGLAGMSEVNGAVHRLQDRISPGYGFTAVIVAYLAKFRPGRVIVAAILFGALILAGREIQPSGVPAMIQGIILFTLIVADVLVRYRIRIERRAPATAAAPPRAGSAPPTAGGSPPNVPTPGIAGGDG